MADTVEVSRAMIRNAIEAGALRFVRDQRVVESLAEYVGRQIERLNDASVDMILQLDLAPGSTPELRELMRRQCAELFSTALSCLLQSTLAGLEAGAKGAASSGQSAFN